jgi:hypothetical protein
MLGREYPFIRKRRTLSQTTIQKTPLVAFGGSAGALSSPNLSPCTCAPWAASAVKLHFRFGGAHLCLGPAHAPPIVQIVVVSAEEVVWACARDALEKISDGREARVAGSLVVEHAATDKIQLWLW